MAAKKNESLQIIDMCNLFNITNLVKETTLGIRSNPMPKSSRAVAEYDGEDDDSEHQHPEAMTDPSGSSSSFVAGTYFTKNGGGS